MKTIPTRNEVNQNDKWDLTSLYKTENDWETDLQKITEYADKIAGFQGEIKTSAEKSSSSL